MNEQSPVADRESYYVRAQSWARDGQQALRRSRNIAYVIAAAAAAIAVLEAVALALLVPLKTVVPYTILVDRQTGYVERAQPLEPGALSQNAAVVQSFLVQYVLARESFDAADLQDDYQKVAAWTEGAARSQYIAEMQPSNPASPERLNEPGAIVKTVIKSVSLLSPTSALVRFDREKQGATTARQAFTAVIGFHAANAPMRMEDRFFNPLGFKVVSYRRDAETAGAVP